MVSPFRMIVILAAMAWIYLRLRLLPGRKSRGPQVLRSTLEGLGPTFIKFGQILALQPHVIPAEYCDALFHLLDQGAQESLSSVRAVIREELGGEPEQVFKNFEWRPLSSASFGQVHTACLVTGERVAVKVQRLNVRKRVQADVRIFYFLARLLDRVGFSGAMRLEPAVRQFDHWTREELDYTIEGNYAAEMAKGAESPIRHIPKVYWQYTTPRILTTEFVEGLPLSKYLRLKLENPPEFERWRKRLELDEQQLVANLMTNYLTDTMIRGVFQADPHAGNIILKKGNAIGYVDFGIMGRLSPENQQIIARYLEAGSRGDADGVVQSFLNLATEADGADPVGFRTALLYEVRRWLTAVAQPDRSASLRSMTHLALRFLALLRRYRMVIPPDTLAFYRTVSTVDGISLMIEPRSDTSELGRRFFQKHRISVLSRDEITEDRLFSALHGYTRLWLLLPDALLQFLSQAPRSSVDKKPPVRPPRAVETGLLVLALALSLSLWFHAFVPKDFDRLAVAALAAALVISIGLALFWRWTK